MKKVSISVLFFCICAVCVFGQKSGSGKERVTDIDVRTTEVVTRQEQPEQYNTEFHISLVKPTDDMADEETGVGTGFGAGFTFYKPIRSVENLSFLWGFDISFNPTSSDYKKEFEEYEDSGVDVTYSNYLNLPIRFGLNYTYPITSGIGIFGEAAIGGNLSYITPFKAEVGDYESTISFTPAFGVFYGVKFGVLFNGKYSLGVSFNNHGTYKYEIKEKGYDSYGGEYEEEYKSDKLSNGSLMFSAGIRF
jgi:hypothetical protein